MIKIFSLTYLRKLNMKELKELCRKHKINKFSTLKKEDLIKHMSKTFRKRERDSMRHQAATVASKKSGCHLPKGCKTKKSSGYSIVQIRELARECNLEVKGKTRSQLCKDIAAALNKPGGKPSPAPAPAPAPAPCPTRADGRKICKSKSGKPYKKGNCNRYGKKKGCVWDP